jgi:hypothetical protein
LLRSAALVAATAWLLGAVVVLDAPQQADDYFAYPVSISLGETENVAGLQFDISLDSNVAQLMDVEAGPAAVGAGKDVVFSVLDGNTIRVLVVGLNQDQLASGVVANLYVAPLQQSAAAPLLLLDGMIVSDPAGNAIAPSAEEAESEEESQNNESPESAEPDAPATEDAAARAAETAAKDGTAVSSGSLMPAILDALMGDYAGTTATETDQDGNGTQPAGSGDAGVYSDGAGEPIPAVGQEGYAGSGVLPPQVYNRTTSTRPATANGVKPAQRTGAVSAASAEQVSGTAQPGGPGGQAAAAGQPMQVSWAQSVSAPGANGVPPIVSLYERLNLKTYVNGRALILAAACAAALILLLRNALLPLIRLLKDLVRS